MSAGLFRARDALARRGAKVICDIDGTLAADVARRHLRPLSEPHCLTGVPSEAIERYMAPELVELDEPIAGASGLLASLLASPGEPRLLLVTARWITLWGTTSRWLERHYPRFQPFLLMRRRSDERPSVEVKLDLIRSYGDCKNGGVWVDDDPRMLLAAERAGFVPLKAPEIFEVANANMVPRRCARREREYLRSRDPRARFLSATAPERIPTGSVLCLCGPDQSCLLCSEQDEEST